jgi:hypothetical protein
VRRGRSPSLIVHPAQTGLGPEEGFIELLGAV